jgi:hypothetical protein
MSFLKPEARSPKPTWVQISHVRVVVACCVLLAGSVARAEVVDRIVAVVGERPVTLSDVRAALALGFVPAEPTEDAERRAVRWLVDRALMLEEVDRYGPGEPDRMRLDERVDAVRRQLGAPELARVLARAGLDEARLRATLRDQLRIDLYLAQRFGSAAQPTDEEVLAHYRLDPSAYAREGVALPVDRALEAARQDLTGTRRAALVSDWLESLRRRADIVVRDPALLSP